MLKKIDCTLNTRGYWTGKFNTWYTVPNGKVFIVKRVEWLLKYAENNFYSLIDFCLSTQNDIGNYFDINTKSINKGDYKNMMFFWWETIFLRKLNASSSAQQDSPFKIRIVGEEIAN